MLKLPNTLLVVEEHRAFLQTIRRAATQRGFSVYECNDLDNAHTTINNLAPDYALIDAGRSDAHLLGIISYLLQVNPSCRCVVTSAHASIASAVAAIRTGAIDYVPKPTTADTVFQSLLYDSESPVANPRPMNPERLYWEYINQVLKANDNNVSVTARKLKMHRRSLQRMLNKTAPPEYPIANNKRP